jgi:hypothetical protein
MKKSGQNSTYKKIVIVTIAISLLVLLFFYYLLHINWFPPPGISVKQQAQFNRINTCLELFKLENNGYPPSSALDIVGQPYCGAMKLCEAMMGQDLLGFHPDSVFRADGMDDTGKQNLYLSTTDNLKARKGRLLQLEDANVFKLADIYGLGNTGPFAEDVLVLCDTYQHRHWTGIKAGMPILYYKADSSKTVHDVNQPDNPENIYNYKDNHALLSLGVPGKPNKKHPLFTNPKIFYEMTKNWTLTPRNKTNQEDSFILLSAGKDGLYGTSDDIANFNIQ